MSHESLPRAVIRRDVVIVGAGAAGLMAAIAAGRRAREFDADLSITALDGSRRLGAKILIAGGGRCNVTHHHVTKDDFHGNRNLIGRVLRSFDVPATVAFFRDLGVALKREETGKLFPVTDRAATVLEALLDALRSAGAELVVESRVEGIERDGSLFVVRTVRDTFMAKRLILATGGRSVPKTGSDGAGYTFARNLGHSVTPTYPALVPLLLPSDHWLTTLRGISHDVELRLRMASGKIVERRSGSMLMTHFGLSGPVVLDISRSWVAASRRNESPLLDCSWTPGRQFEEIETSLLDESRRHPRKGVTSVLSRQFPDRLAEALAMHAAGIDPSTPLGRLTREQRRALARVLTEMPLPVRADRGFDYAEVTAGGVPLEEVDTATMESRIAPGLHLCGEILDVDGRIGGFNFQWAWASGRLAGLGAVEGLIHG